MTAMKRHSEPPYTPLIASVELQRQVSDVLDLMCTGNLNDVIKHTPALQELAFEPGFTDALSNLVNCDKPLKRVYVARYLMHQLGSESRSAGYRMVQKCERILTESLSHPSLAIRLEGAAGLSQTHVPAEAIRPLRHMLQSAAPEESVGAALALRHSEEPEPAAIHILTACLKSPEPDTAAMAAAALLQMGVQTQRAIAVVKKHFAKLAPHVLRFVLLAVGKAGNVAIELFADIESIVGDVKREPVLRQAAAYALGGVSFLTDADERAQAVFVKLLGSSDASLMDGAILGFLEVVAIPPAGMKLLATKLFDANVRVRRSAAWGFNFLKGMYEFPPVIALLVNRLREEDDHPALRQIAETVAASGAVAIPYLIERVRQGTAQEYEYCGGALAGMGEAAAQAIAARLPSLTGEREQTNLLLTLESMGARARPAVPTLAAMLDSTGNRMLVFLILRTLFFCGPAAAAALPAVARCLTRADRDDPDIQEWAERILAANPGGAREALASAIESTVQSNGTRLKEVLRRVHADSSAGAKLLDGFHDMKAVMRFAAMATLLQNAPASMRRLSEILSKRNGGKGFSQGSLRAACRDLKKHVGRPLVDYGTPPVMLILTDTGKQVLGECRNLIDSTKIL